MSKKKKKLNPKHERFITEYLLCLNATQAAINAGYSEKTARTQGNQHLTKLDILEKINSKLKQVLDNKEQILKNKVIAEYEKLAFSNIKDFIDENGNFDLENADTSIISSYEIIEHINGKDSKIVKTKLKLWSKTKALEGLFKYLGLLAEIKVKLSGNVKFDIELVEKLKELPDDDLIKFARKAASLN